MRALLARSVRPRVGSVVTPGNPAVALSVRQAVFRPTRRKLTFNDAFTILLAPVLAAVFVIDITSKDRRRIAWEKKIAEIREEIEELRKNELRAWTALQLQPLYTGITVQRRSFSTMTRSSLIPEEEQEDLTTSVEEGDGIVRETEAGTLDEDDLSNLNSADLNLDKNRMLHQNGHEGQQTRHVPFQDRLPSSAEVAEWTRYETLVASKLALEMLLHLRTGKNILSRHPEAMILNAELYPDSIDKLVHQLNQVRQSLNMINRRKEPRPVPESLLDKDERHELQFHIVNLVRACKSRRITVQDLVYGYANAISQFKAPPNAETYRLMIEAFSIHKNDPLAYTVMGALQNSKQVLSDQCIWTILYQYGHFRDGGRLHNFLWLLCKRKSILTLGTKWQQITVNGVSVIAPVTNNHDFLLVLIRAGLACDQPHLAEAWTTLLFRSDQDGKKIAVAFRSILTYYTQRANWTYGYRWVIESLKWSSVLATQLLAELARTVLQMLELCVVCEQREIYEEILEAAVSARLFVKVQADRPSLISDRMQRIRQDWSDRLDARENGVQESSYTNTTGEAEQTLKKIPTEQAIHFQKKLSRRLPELIPYIGVSNSQQLAQIRRTQTNTTDQDSKVHPFQSTEAITMPGDHETKQLKRYNKQLQTQITKHTQDLENIEVKYRSRAQALQDLLATAKLQSSKHHETIQTYQKELDDLRKNEMLNKQNNLRLQADHRNLSKDFAALQARHALLSETNARLMAKLQGARVSDAMDIQQSTAVAAAAAAKPQSLEHGSSISPREETDDTRIQPLNWKARIRLRRELHEQRDQDSREPEGLQSDAFAKLSRYAGAS